MHNENVHVGNVVNGFWSYAHRQKRGHLLRGWIVVICKGGQLLTDKSVANYHRDKIMATCHKYKLVVLC